MLLIPIIWGSWANTLKLTRATRYEIYYWDFVIGALILSITLGFTWGTWGDFDLSFVESLLTIHLRHALRAFISGILFNIANILLIASASLTGISFSFITCFSCALVVDTIIFLTIHRFNHLHILLLGLFFILCSVMSINLIFKKNVSKELVVGKARTLAIIGGILTGLFHPLLERSLSSGGTARLDPCTAHFFFILGLLICNLFANFIFMKNPLFGQPVSIQSYFNTKKKVHLLSMLGGAIWALGMSFILFLRYQQAPSGPLFFLINLSTAITFLWGVLLWKEVPQQLHFKKYILFCFFTYLLAISIISLRGGLEITPTQPPPLQHGY